MGVEKEGKKKGKKRKKRGEIPRENAKQLRGFAHARKIRLFPLETENGENNLCRLRIFLDSRRFSLPFVFVSKSFVDGGDPSLLSKRIRHRD